MRDRRPAVRGQWNRRHGWRQSRAEPL